MRRSPLFSCLLVLVLVTLVHEASAQGWSDRTSGTGPSPRQRHGLCYDPVRGYVLLSGGLTQTWQASNETWSWDGSVWTPRGSAPASFRCLAVYAASNRLFGLAPTGSSPFGFQSYEWDGSQWTSQGSIAMPMWPGDASTQILAAYDATRQELLVLPATYGPVLAVAVFDGTTWSSRPCTTPLPDANIDNRAMAWDPTVAKVVCAQGEHSIVLIGSAWLGIDVIRFYEWNGFGWNLRMLPTAPGLVGAMATDLQGNRVVMLDGDQPNLQIPGSNQPYHTWTYANGACTRLSTTVAPAPRIKSAMAFDPVRGVSVLVGGYYQSQTMGDTWEFDLGPQAAFTPFGAGCAGSRGVPQLVAQGSSVPRIGTTFSAHVSNLPWTGPAFALVGLSNTSYSGVPLPIDLTMLGAPGCSLLTSIEDLQPLANVLGTAIWSFPVPPVPGASFYTQVLPFDPGVNGLGLTASNAGHALIGL